jgi:hypothetical protein
MVFLCAYLSSFKFSKGKQPHLKPCIKYTVVVPTTAKQPPRYQLHSFVIWAAGAFGSGPADIVKGAFSLAGLAVQTVGGIGGLDLASNGIIDARGTKSDAGGVEFRGAFLGAGVAIDNRQMTGLVFAMISCGKSSEGILVEGLSRFIGVFCGGKSLVVFVDFKFGQKSAEDG